MHITGLNLDELTRGVNVVDTCRNIYYVARSLKKSLIKDQKASQRLDQVEQIGNGRKFSEKFKGHSSKPPKSAKFNLYKYQI